MSPAHRRAANQVREGQGRRAANRALEGARTATPPVSHCHQLVAWFHDAGLVDARVDAVGNVRGGAGPTEAPGSGRDAGILLLGSHYDTVPNGGAYDGALGLVAALAAVKAVAAAGAAGGCGSPPPPASWRRRVEVVAFADEEGVRYGTTFLGSGALAGRGGAVFASARDAGGASPLDALRAAGLATSLADVQAAAIDPAACRGYVEAHAEQGPVLETSRARLAPVAAIAGQTRLRVAITGVAGHAGTVPMTGRRDAGAAAAAAAVAVEAACGGGPVRASPLPAPVMRALDLAWQTLPATVREAVSAAATATARRPHPSPGLVCTVGELALHPGAPNVIPGGALLTVDVRAPDDGARLAALARVRRAVASLCAARQVGCDVTTVHEAPASQPDMALSRALAAAAAASERGWARAVAVADAPRRDPDPGATAHVGAAMVSGAGHDALALAGTMPVRGGRRGSRGRAPGGRQRLRDPRGASDPSRGVPLSFLVGHALRARRGRRIAHAARACAAGRRRRGGRRAS